MVVESGSQSYINYIREQKRIAAYMMSHRNVLKLIAKNFPMFFDSLDSNAQDEHIESFENFAENLDKVTGIVDDQLPRELFLCHAVHNTVVYFTEIVLEVFQTCPSFIPADFQGVDEYELRKLISNKFGYKISTISRTLNKYLQIQISDLAPKLLFNQAFETRNLIVHHRGVITRKYKDVLGLKESQIGQHLVLSDDETYDYIAALHNLVRAFDHHVTEAYSLKKSEIEHPQLQLV